METLIELPFVYFLVYVWIGDRFGEITVAHVDSAKVISNSNMHLIGTNLTMHANEN
jgi:3-deoxy-D-arabino-heptulosonate 7-phosphate (DAHP) synthase class II